MFEDTKDAAIKLAQILPKEQLIKDDWLLVCISLKSVMLTDIVAKELGINYEILFNEAILAPNNPDCTIAMVSETEEIIYDENLIKSFDRNLDFIYGEAHRKYEEKILKNIYQYRKGDLIGSLNNKNILIIDEGFDTDMSILVCIKTIINEKAKSLAYATPIMPYDVYDTFNALTDDLFIFERIRDYVNVDFYYHNNKELDQETIKAILEDSPYYLPLQKNTGEFKTCNIQLK